MSIFFFTPDSNQSEASLVLMRASSKTSVVQQLPRLQSLFMGGSTLAVFFILSSFICIAVDAQFQRSVPAAASQYDPVAESQRQPIVYPKVSSVSFGFS